MDGREDLWAELVRAMVPAGLELYYPEGDGEAFWRKVRSGEQYAEDLAEIRSEGERLLAAPSRELSYSVFSLFHTKGSRLEYEQLYFEKRRRLNTFAILSLIEPESDRYHAALLDAIWSICSELTWCLPAHVSLDKSVAASIDLFLAETGFTLAELRLLFGSRLPEILRARIAELVEARLFLPFVEEGPFSWEEAEHNWSAVCAGSIGAAALLLLNAEEDTERLARILEKTERSMGYYLRGFGDDGACLEGLGYWNYGFGYFVYYADLLLARSGGKRDWFREEKVSRIASFQQKCFLGGNAVVNFSDALPYASVQLGLSSYLAGKYEEVHAPSLTLRADYREDHCSRWAPAFRNLIWRDRCCRSADDWGAGDFLLKNADWLISRTVAGAGIFGFAAKGGHNDEPHNHNDLGQFVLACSGEFYISDLGCGEYTKDYFRDGRYKYDCNGSQGHSVPIIDGVLQAEGRDRQAETLETFISDGEDRMTIELSAAYPHTGLESFLRSWSWHKSVLPGLRLRDEFHFTLPPGMLTERFVTLLPPVLNGKDGLIVLQGKKSGVRLELHYDQDMLRAEVNERIYRNHFGINTPWYALDFHAVNLKEQMTLEFLFQFVL